MDASLLGSQVALQALQITGFRRHNRQGPSPQRGEPGVHPLRMQRRPLAHPGNGEHTEEILPAAGYAWEDIEGMKNAETI